MSQKGKIRRAFAGGNTSEGFVCFYDYIIEPDAARVFVIKGGPGAGKSTFMEKISTEMINNGYDVECFHCSSDDGSLDALVVPALRIALLDGTAPHIYDPKNPGAVGEIINLGDYWREREIVHFKDEILEVSKRRSRLFSIAYSQLREAKVAYDELKSYVRESISQAKYNRIIKILLENIFEGVIPNYQIEPKVRHLFASAIAPQGPCHYIETLINPSMKVFALKGQPGSGVKEAICKIALAAEEIGLYTERFHCPFEPDLLDMVIIPSINAAVVNTSPPFHFNIHQTDDLKLRIEDEVDFSDCIRMDILEKYYEELADAEKRYVSLVYKAVAHIAKARTAHKEMEQYYVTSMDFDGINAKSREILGRIMKYARQ